mmetsp:Transcript_53556/g.79601  ORF Transcript_53556/g.79601 Transcript_53556/m.79601 type:complete len:102 (-) Transcript_53556:339-644(-)|eukprot:CAMPEP_0195506728 /NCGR_PEP_ID=MMETSP0794_2-20130614/303_1 /TAXON_ID=515487 /ORGANISM="Stephanopyxis turris, Strain CCMP 815" /LENGTH=101 /DNA_ID=CAMNT_0040633143 /DNA_START=88 /DNA_END=393 /DNA_ORIENTATION=+
MPIDKISLIRKLSERGDPDFIEDSYYEGSSTHVLTKDYCENILKEFKGDLSKAPIECRKHFGVGDRFPSKNLDPARNLKGEELVHRQTQYKVWKEGAEEPV